MLEWLDSVAGPDYAPAILWTLAALVLLVVVLFIVRLVRRLTFGTFVSGGRNRKTRLAVMDATAVDSHRRLVLVRRDDIEHLLLIGGPTDVVVERDIRLVAARRPVLTGDTGQPQPVGAASRQPQPGPLRPVQPRQSAAPQSPSAPARDAAPAQKPPYPKPAPAGLAPAYAPGANGGRPTPQVAPARRDAIDDALMDELDLSLDDTPAAARPAAKAPPPSLDDEMTKLLGELSSHKRRANSE